MCSSRLLSGSYIPWVPSPKAEVEVIRLHEIITFAEVLSSGPRRRQAECSEVSGRGEEVA